MLKIGNISKLTMVINLFFTFQVLAQHEDRESEHEEPEPHRHMISVQIGHTHLSEGARNGEKKWTG